MPLPRELIDTLACPKCKQRLVGVEAKLVCAHCRLGFAITDNVPVLLVDEAEPLSQSDVDRLVKLAKEQGLTGA